MDTAARPESKIPTLRLVKAILKRAAVPLSENRRTRIRGWYNWSEGVDIDEVAAGAAVSRYSPHTNAIRRCYMHEPLMLAMSAHSASSIASEHNPQRLRELLSRAVAALAGAGIKTKQTGDGEYTIVNSEFTRITVHEQVRNRSWRKRRVRTTPGIVLPNKPEKPNEHN